MADLDRILDYLSVHARADIIDHPEWCPLEIDPKTKSLRVRNKTRQQKEATKADVIQWASVYVDGFDDWLNFVTEFPADNGLDQLRAALELNNANVHMAIDQAMATREQVKCVLALARQVRTIALLGLLLFVTMLYGNRR